MLQARCLYEPCRQQVLAEVAACSGEPGPPGSCGGERACPPAPPAGSAALAAALQQVHYVDAGLNSRGAYLTDPEAVTRLGEWCRAHPHLQVFLHGTPRQWGAWVPG